MADRRFEDKPATKHDLAEVKEELGGQIEGLEAKVDRIEKNMVTIEKNMATKADMKAEFHNLREILKGPQGIAERLEKVEERVGLR